MTTKLTLSVEKAVIEKAKRYAQDHNKSLSEIVEHYLEYLTEDQDSTAEIDSDILELSDSIPVESLPEVDEAKYRYIKEKYLDA